MRHVHMFMRMRMCMLMLLTCSCAEHARVGAGAGGWRRWLLGAWLSSLSHLPATMNIQVAISTASSSASSLSSARTASHSSRPRRLSRICRTARGQERINGAAGRWAGGRRSQLAVAGSRRTVSGEIIHCLGTKMRSVSAVMCCSAKTPTPPQPSSPKRRLGWMVPPAASSQECSAARCASLVGAAAAAGGVEPALRFLEPAIPEATCRRARTPKTSPVAWCSLKPLKIA